MIPTLPTQLPTVQAIVLRELLRSWRSRYALRIADLRARTKRTITWNSLRKLQQRGLVTFGPFGWQVPLLNGKPIFRVTKDDRVLPIKPGFELWARLDPTSSVPAGDV